MGHTLKITASEFGSYGNPGTSADVLRSVAKSDLHVGRRILTEVVETAGEGSQGARRSERS